jgi:hypothetical protein
MMAVKASGASVVILFEGGIGLLQS